MLDMSKKVLFIDRDGTLVLEPPVDYQLDSLEKLEFYPKVFQYMAKIASELEYELVMVTNQDGLGTDSFPEATFWPAQNKVLSAFQKEGVVFSEVLIDKTFPHENAETRKPRTGLLTKYFSEEYDLENSFVLGDRITDMELAKNLGAKGIYLSENAELGANEIETSKQKILDCISLTSTDWSEIYNFLKLKDRVVEITRNTNETKIYIKLNLDGSGKNDINTGLSFFDHMLDQIATHGGFELNLRVDGDLHIDDHHSVEDTALALGEALKKALGDKRGIGRFGFALPMDECRAECIMDISNRPHLKFEAEFSRDTVGEMATEMVPHFFYSIAQAMGLSLHLSTSEGNAHHQVESLFKVFGRALRQAIQKNGEALPSSKGTL